MIKWNLRPFWKFCTKVDQIIFCSCSFSHKVTFYMLRNNFRSSSCAKNTSMWCRGQRLCAPAILPTNCYEILFCAQNPNIFHWRISTLCCTDLSPLPERYRVEPSRWGALEEKPSHNLLQPVVRHACAMICVVLEVSVKHVSLLCLTTTGLVASVKYYK